MKKWEAIFNKQKGIYEVYPEKAGDIRICAVVNQIDENKIAHLIAAAPELLAACKIGLEYINQANKCSKPDCRACLRLKQDKKAILEAIAKAEAV